MGGVPPVTVPIKKDVACDGFGHVAFRVQHQAIIDRFVPALGASQHLFQAIEMLDPGEQRLRGQTDVADAQTDASSNRGLVDVGVVISKHKERAP